MAKARKGLGRIPAPDRRDLHFAARRLVSATPTRSYRYFHDVFQSDQGSKPHCVAHAGIGWLEDGPITYDGPTPNPEKLYPILQDHDEWPGRGYDGTSVRALGRVLSDVDLCRAAGIETEKPLIREYRWAFTPIEAMLAVLEGLPLVAGTNWPLSFDRPDKDGFVRYLDSTGIAGGHAYRITGGKVVLLPGGKLADPTTWDRDKSFLRAKNSWGPNWGLKGRFLIPLTVFDRLLHEDGECMVAVEESG